MPGSKGGYPFRPKREFKRGFWWTLGAVFAYALVGTGAFLAVTYWNREGGPGGVKPLGRIESGTCVSGACPEVWAR